MASSGEGFGSVYIFQQQNAVKRYVGEQLPDALVCQSRQRDTKYVDWEAEVAGKSKGEGGFTRARRPAEEISQSAEKKTG